MNEDPHRIIGLRAIRLSSSTLPAILMALSIPFLLLGCRGERRLQPALWKSSDPVFDSIMSQLEYQFIEYAPFDSIEESLTALERRIGSIRELRPAETTLLQSRLDFWRGKYLFRLEKTDSARLLLSQALSLNDSVRYPYDRMRIRAVTVLLPDEEDGGRIFEALDQMLKWSEKNGDCLTDATTAAPMASLLISIHQHAKAETMLARADRNFSRLGLNRAIVKNRINWANLYNATGNDSLAVATLKSILDAPELIGDTLMMNMVPRNLYAMTGNRNYLLRAYDQIADSPRFRFLKVLYAAILGKHAIESDPDSARMYLREVQENMTAIADDNTAVYVYEFLSLYHHAAGEWEKGWEARLKLEEATKRLNAENLESEVMLLMARETIEEKERTWKRETERATLIWVSGLLVLAAAGGWGMMWLQRRNLKTRMLAMEQELQIEKLRRQFSSSTVTLQEKNRLLSDIKTELGQIGRDGELSGGSTHRLEAVIKSHLAESDAEKVDRDILEELNPRFFDNLRARCPGIAETYVRMAGYILLGLDNKRIAGLMNIKTESVHQARWRLRRRLGLSSDDSLEDTLRDLNLTR